MNNGINMKMFSHMGEMRNKKMLKSSVSSSAPPVPAPVLTSSNIGQTTNINAIAGDQIDVVKTVDLGPGPVFWSGWVKYINYDKLFTPPKNFFKNNEFYQQLKTFPKASNETSFDGLKTVSTYIKSPSHFYFLLFRDSVNFVSSRDKQIKKTYDILTIDQLEDVTEEPGYGAEKMDKNDNGIQDYGNFAEGYCFKLLTVTKNWIICTDTIDDKKELMSKMNKLKIMGQRDKGVFNIKQKPVDNTIQNMLNPDYGTSGKMLNDGKGNLSVNGTDNPTDGYWIMLQDWTQCSLKCGGGISTLHRMCVPPKTGGKACDGNPIMTRPCNSQPCPKVKEIAENGINKRDNNTMKPLVKVMPFSTRPQRYSKCVIKEADLMYTQNFASAIQNNPDLTVKPGTTDVQAVQIPVRVVMNSKTFSIFGGEDYTSLVSAFNLDAAQFGRSNLHKGCFVLKELKMTSELCGFGMDGSDAVVEEWDYHFNLFKHQCHSEKERVESEMERDIEEKLKDKMRGARQSLLEEQQKSIQKRAMDQDQTEMKNIIKSTNDVAVQAISKELNLEALIQQEETEREQKEEELMLKQIEDEKKKSECFMKAIKERQLENQYNVKTLQTQEEVLSIKKTAIDQVTVRRNSLKAKIAKMRVDANRRTERLTGQLNAVRQTMAAAMSNVYKRGDENRCVKGMETDENRKNYCVANFPEDLIQFNSCNGDKDEFCRICCETEYGEMYNADRTKCYNTICKAKTITTEGPRGRWIWQTPH